MTFNYKELSTLDHFDSRDVVERLNEITENYTALIDNGDVTVGSAYRDEMKILSELLEELAEHFPPSHWMDVRTDTECGVSGFAEHYAVEYAEEYASDVYRMDREQPWPFNHIDWEAAADELKENYMEVEILGSTFYLRD